MDRLGRWVTRQKVVLSELVVSSDLFLRNNATREDLDFKRKGASRTYERAFPVQACVFFF